MNLNDEVYNQILELSEMGNELVDLDELDGAIEKYQLALNLVPEPKYDWEASTWLYGALGDTCFLNQQYEKALEYLCESLKCPDGLGNPFILLRIGECFFELNNTEKAENYLVQAYMLAGKDIFEDELEKYYESIKNKL